MIPWKKDMKRHIIPFKERYDPLIQVWQSLVPAHHHSAAGHQNQKKKSFGRFYFNFLWSGARWRWRHFWEKMTLWEWSEVTPGPIFENDGRQHRVQFLRMIGGDTLSNFWEWSPGPTFENDRRRHRVQFLRMIRGDTGSNFSSKWTTVLLLLCSSVHLQLVKERTIWKLGKNIWSDCRFSLCRFSICRLVNVAPAAVRKTNETADCATLHLWER